MTAEWQTPRWEPREGETGLAIFHKTNKVPERVFLMGHKKDFESLVEYIYMHRDEERQQTERRLSREQTTL